MSKRFVSVYVDMMREAIFDDSEMFKTYVWILSQMRYKDGYIILHKVKVDLKRGEALIESRKWAAEVLNLSENRYRKILKDLEELGYVKIESTNRYTIIKPLKWALFEQLDDNNNQPTTNRAPTGHQPTTNSYINIKDNIRNIKEIYNNKRAVNGLQLLKIKIFDFYFLNYLIISISSGAVIFVTTLPSTTLCSTQISP